MKPPGSIPAVVMLICATDATDQLKTTFTPLTALTLRAFWTTSRSKGMMMNNEEEAYFYNTVSEFVSLCEQYGGDEVFYALLNALTLRSVPRRFNRQRDLLETVRDIEGFFFNEVMNGLADREQALWRE
jgi:hypothetical protein